MKGKLRKKSQPAHIPFGAPFAGLTDVGQVRASNEDSLLTPADYQIDTHAAEERGFLFIVADGMGGAQAGEVASSMAVNLIRQTYYADVPTLNPAEALQRGVRIANEAIHCEAEENEEHHGMGTTVTAAVLVGEKLWIAQVGDSRAYLLRNDELIQITRDHSYVQEMVSLGYITVEEARNHPYRNRITRVLGGNETVEVDIFPDQLHPGEMLLLCSDGLTGEMEDEEIRQILRSATSPEEAAKHLISNANKKGGRDNITVVVVQSSAGQPRPNTAQTTSDGRSTKRKGKWNVALGLLVLFAVVALVALRVFLPGLFWPETTPSNPSPSVSPSPSTTTPSPSTTTPSPSTTTPSPTETSTPPSTGWLQLMTPSTSANSFGSQAIELDKTADIWQADDHYVFSPNESQEQRQASRVLTAPPAIAPDNSINTGTQDDKSFIFGEGKTVPKMPELASPPFLDQRQEGDILAALVNQLFFFNDNISTQNDPIIAEWMIELTLPSLKLTRFLLGLMTPPFVYSLPLDLESGF